MALRQRALRGWGTRGASSSSTFAPSVREKHDAQVEVVHTIEKFSVTITVPATATIEEVKIALVEEIGDGDEEFVRFFIYNGSTAQIIDSEKLGSKRKLYGTGFTRPIEESIEDMSSDVADVNAEESEQESDVTPTEVKSVTLLNGASVTKNKELPVTPPKEMKPVVLHINGTNGTLAEKHQEYDPVAWLKTMAPLNGSTVAEEDTPRDVNSPRTKSPPSTKSPPMQKRYTNAEGKVQPTSSLASANGHYRNGHTVTAENRILEVKGLKENFQMDVINSDEDFDTILDRLQKLESPTSALEPLVIH